MLVIRCITFSLTILLIYDPNYETLVSKSFEYYSEIQDSSSIAEKNQI